MSQKSGTHPEGAPEAQSNSTPHVGSSKTIVATASPRPARSRGVFTITGGSQVGRVLSVPAGVVATLGRSEECIFRLDDASLSRVHARVMRVGTDYVFHDAESTNGSFINDARATTPVQLHDGDRLQLGSSVTLRFSLVDEQEEKALQKVYEATMRDGLTGVFNRKHLEECIDAELAYATRHHSALSLVMLDVDHFKQVNDTYGHLAGDAVLKNTASVLLRGLRTEDLVARYGGEEFVVIARGIQAHPAVLMADRLRMLVAQTPASFENKAIGVTISAGVASLVCCGDRTDKTTLIGIADSRLYQAKEAGRNRVIGPALTTIIRKRCLLCD